MEVYLQVYIQKKETIPLSWHNMFFLALRKVKKKEKALCSRLTHICICQLHLWHGHRRRNPLCNGRRRRRRCCRCTWGIRPTLGYSCPQRWGRCCYCNCRPGMSWIYLFHQEGPQRSRRHIVHIVYLETVNVRMIICCNTYYIHLSCILYKL